MNEHQFWGYKNGDVYAVEIKDGNVVGACGPLYYGELLLADPSEFDCNSEDGEWVNENADDFRYREGI